MCGSFSHDGRPPARYGRVVTTGRQITVAKNVKKPKVKDLEPKARAQKVKGGSLQRFDAEEQAKYYARRAEYEARKRTIPR